MDIPPAVPNQESTLPDAFSLLMRSIGDYAIILMDPSGTIVNWNSGAARMFGFDPSECVGRNSSFLFPTEEIAAGVPRRELESALSQGRGGEDCWNLRKDGSKFWGSSVVYPLSRENGESAGFVKIMRDAGAQRESADALSESERKMDVVLENLKGHGIFLINHKAIIITWNKGAERLFGFKAEEVLGKPFSTVFTPEDILAGVPDRELIVARSEGKSEDERWHQRKDGSRFWASGAVMPVHGDREKSDFIKILRDATDRKRSEDADRMESIGRLAGGVAHDYNNMLTSIIGYCELLSDSIPEDALHQRWLEEMLTSANRAATLTRDLLAFSRKQMIAPEPVNLNDLIRKMDGQFRMTLGGHIRLHYQLDAELELAHLDKGQIEQVLLNLALNAREAMPEGGDVTIRTVSASATQAALESASPASAATVASAAAAVKVAKAAGAGGPGEIPPASSSPIAEFESHPYLTLIFKDNGKGMDAETSAHAFDPFFSTKPKSAGSVGMGLSTGYGIIQQSGGTISLSSVPESGTEFEIRFPVFRKKSPDAQRKEPVEVKSMARSGMDRARNETILLVEDESAVRNLTSEVLRKNGFQILEAKDGKEGLAIFDSQPDRIDLVVTDVVMPELGGVAMARRILSRRPETAIVFMSGYSEDALSEPGMAGRNCDFLHKPFSVANLLGKIDQALDKKAGGTRYAG